MPGVACGIDHEVKRKTESVVELERLLAGIRGARLGTLLLRRNQRSQIFVESLQTLTQRARKTRLLNFNHVRDALGALNQFRIRVLHLIANRKHHLIEEWLLLTKQAFHDEYARRMILRRT